MQAMKNTKNNIILKDINREHELRILAELSNRNAPGAPQLNRSKRRRIEKLKKRGVL